ncbi:hypothetical protein F5Y19DRAFT_191653 [Xylariaceae sp. FL1651]|nr:hypothetical protein F5Y19DRAFT_191653 [Xylariaceae sp. FL1651]
MSLSKDRISSPLEAGRSILEAHHLPSYVTGALEYASKRLARKSLHITLIVVRNDYQLPNTPHCATPASPPQTPEHLVAGFASPSRFTYPVSGLRQLVRRGTGNSLASSNSTSTSSSSSSSSSSEIGPTAWASPTFPPPSAEPIASPRRWILPLTPGSPLPSTPVTPHTPSSIATTVTASSSCATSHAFQSTESFGIRLLSTSSLSLKDEKTLRATIAKAERKFHIEAGGLPAITTASACGLNADLVRRSILQNEVLFSSEGLTLLGLDRLYSFKAALATYARSIFTPNPTILTPLRSPGLSNHPINSLPPTSPSTTADSSRLEDAVDSLRRLVLANSDRPVLKADLYRNFCWMGVSSTALADVEQMYRRAYGGPERRGPFEVPAAVTNEWREREQEANAKRIGHVKIRTPPTPKTQTTPVLKLNTNVPTTPRVVRPKPKAVPQVMVAGRKATTDTKSSLLDADNDTNKERRSDVEKLEISIDGLEIATKHSGYYDEEDGDRTAHPLRDGPLRPSMFWPNGNALGASIDELLSPVDNRQSQRLGPTTPNGYEDISPITRGEWGFLFKGDTWTQGRTAAVETC